MLDELKKIGLSENEAKVYLTALELGSSTAQQIAQRAGLKRPTTYVQLESLMKRGLATSFEKGPSTSPGQGKTMFRSEDPEHLKQVLEKEEEEHKEKAGVLEKILPGLGNLYLSAGERPRVRFFEGISGLKTIQDEFLKTKERLVRSVANADDVLETFPMHGENYIPKRAQKGIHSKLIYTSAKGHILGESDARALRESKFVPLDKFPLSGEIAIYGNIVSISMFRKKPFGVILEGGEIAKSFQAIFDLLWEKM
ncbi:MAG: helix-turn-helix domain-containing protein [Patescibacteria group bacterium]